MFKETHEIGNHVFLFVSDFAIQIENHRNGRALANSEQIPTAHIWLPALYSSKKYLRPYAFFPFNHYLYN